MFTSVPFPIRDLPEDHQARIATNNQRDRREYGVSEGAHGRNYRITQYKP